MEQDKTKDNSIKIYYTELTPCDGENNFVKTSFIPSFIIEDTKKFRESAPKFVVQLPTRFGWAIVSKWENDGRTYIYGLSAKVVFEGVAILNTCDYCEWADNPNTVYSKLVSKEDEKIFYGRDELFYIKEENND